MYDNTKHEFETSDGVTLTAYVTTIEVESNLGTQKLNIITPTPLPPEPLRKHCIGLLMHECGCLMLLTEKGEIEKMAVVHVTAMEMEAEEPKPNPKDLN